MLGKANFAHVTTHNMTHSIATWVNLSIFGDDLVTYNHVSLSNICKLWWEIGGYIVQHVSSRVCYVEIRGFP